MVQSGLIHHSGLQHRTNGGFKTRKLCYHKDCLSSSPQSRTRVKLSRIFFVTFLVWPKFPPQTQAKHCKQKTSFHLAYFRLQYTHSNIAPTDSEALMLWACGCSSIQPRPAVQTAVIQACRLAELSSCCGCIVAAGCMHLARSRQPPHALSPLHKQAGGRDIARHPSQPARAGHRVMTRSSGTLAQ